MGGGGREKRRPFLVAAYSANDEGERDRRSVATEDMLRMTSVHPEDAALYLGALFPLHGSDRDKVTGKDVCTDLQVS